MRRLDRHDLTVRLADHDIHLGVQVAPQQGVEASGRDDVAGGDLGVVGVVRKSERQDTLLRQVRAVNPSKGAPVRTDLVASAGQRK